MTAPLRSITVGSDADQSALNFPQAVDPTGGVVLDSTWVSQAVPEFTYRSLNNYAEIRAKSGASLLNLVSARQKSDLSSAAQEEDGAGYQPVPPSVNATPVSWSRTSTFYALQEWEGYVDSVDGDQVIVRLVDLTAGERFASQKTSIPLEEFNDDDFLKLKPGSVFRWAIGYQRSGRGTKMRVSNIVFRELPRWTKSELNDADRESDQLSKFLNSAAAE
jgi:hypothetical protein